jgi:hypothetical protein
VAAAAAAAAVVLVVVVVVVVRFLLSVERNCGRGTGTVREHMGGGTSTVDSGYQKTGEDHN